MIDPNKLRLHVLNMIYKSQSGHIGSSFSLAEIIAYLYEHYPTLIDNEDKLILSKGHGVPILYAVLYELGIIKSLDNFREINSPLQGHPQHRLLPAVNATTGSLGQGLSIAIGHALASKKKNINNKIFCIIGDGELQEGQIWEALLLAPKLKLNNLICIIDHNSKQNDGYLHYDYTDKSAYEKFHYMGWYVHVCCDGHDFDILEESFRKKHDYAPKLIIANTKKNAGIESFGNENWHGTLPTKDQYEKMVESLNEKISKH